MAEIPIMHVGKYAGKRVDQLPNSYLRWMMTQDFPRDILEAAKDKLSKSKYDNSPISISRHALDMFSLRFLNMWKDYNFDRAISMQTQIGDDIGLATFIAQHAQKAWEHGDDHSKYRHEDDGIVREYEGVKYVFAVSEQFPEYKEVITIM